MIYSRRKSSNQPIQILDIETNRQLKTYDDQEVSGGDEIFKIVFSPDGKLFAALEEKRICIYDISDLVSVVKQAERY